MEDAIKCIKELVEEYQGVITNANFIIELLEIILKNSLMSFNGEYFQQNFGVIMGTNVAPILANIYIAKLEALLKEKCKTDIKLKWPILFKRFIDDGLVSWKETHWILNTGFQNSICYSKPSPLTNLNLETRWTSWICLYTKERIFL